MKNERKIKLGLDKIGEIIADLVPDKKTAKKVSFDISKIISNEIMAPAREESCEKLVEMVNATLENSTISGTFKLGKVTNKELALSFVPIGSVKKG